MKEEVKIIEFHVKEILFLIFLILFFGNILLLGYKSEELRPPLTNEIILTPAGGFLSH